MTSKADIDISVRCDLWPDLHSQIENAVLKIIERTNPSYSFTDISIVLADNAFIRDLNKTYRGKDEPTNVLSFPQDEGESLGDVILAFETVQAEAKSQNKSFEHHALHLVIHGVLHLLGYDHETKDEADEMEELEIKTLRDIGIKNPYETPNSMA